jgi:hypothetical protein
MWIAVRPRCRAQRTMHCCVAPGCCLALQRRDSVSRQPWLLLRCGVPPTLLFAGRDTHLAGAPPLVILSVRTSSTRPIYGDG